jgi:hypothetical protein
VRAHDGKRFFVRGSKPPARQAERSGKRVWEWQPPPAKRFVVYGSGPSTRQAERSEKRGCEGGTPHLPSTSLPAEASRLQDKPSAAENGGVGAAAPTCNKKNMKVGYTTLSIRECASARRLAERLLTAPQAKSTKTTTRCGCMLSRNRRREAPHAGISEYECMIRRLMDIEECWKLFESTQDCAAREGQRERERERERRGGVNTANTHALHIQTKQTQKLTRTRKPSAAVRPSAAEKAARGSPSTTLQHSTPTRATSQSQWRREIPPTAIQHAHATKRQRERLKAV